MNFIFFNKAIKFVNLIPYVNPCVKNTITEYDNFFPRFDFTVRGLHCFYGWLTYVVVYIIILPRSVPLIWDWFGRISICFFIHSNRSLILQSFLFTNSWPTLLWCIVRCFFWCASAAVGWVFWLFIIAICVLGLISVLAIYCFIFNISWFAIFSMLN